MEKARSLGLALLTKERDKVPALSIFYWKRALKNISLDLKRQSKPKLFLAFHGELKQNLFARLPISARH